MDVNAGLIDDKPALLSVEFEESPLTTGGSDWKVRVGRAADTDDASLFHVEGKSGQRGVFLHLRPGCRTNFRIAVPEPEVIVDSVEIEARCTLVHGEVDTEEDRFTAEDLIVIKGVSNVGCGTWLEDHLQREYERSEHLFVGSLAGHSDRTRAKRSTTSS